MFLGILWLCFSFICFSSHSKLDIINNNTNDEGSSESTITRPDSTIGPSRTSEASSVYVNTSTSDSANNKAKEFTSTTYVHETTSIGESEFTASLCLEGKNQSRNEMILCRTKMVRM